MKGAFFIVGPTATGKSELAAEVAALVSAEVVSADAFQIYRGLPLLTAKPDDSTLAKAPHHLIGTVALEETMNAEKFREMAARAIVETNARGKLALVVGGSGLYLKALSHGLAPTPAADRQLREKLSQLTLHQLYERLADLDPETARRIDRKNRPRLVRAIEICLMTGQPASAQRQEWKREPARPGVFVFRDREELYERINQRVEAMFEKGVIEEVRAVEAISDTAMQTIGFSAIRKLVEGKMSISQCIAEIQQSTRRYAKRQLTWFRRQTNFEPLNLSLLSDGEAVKWITQRVSLSCGQG